MSPFYYIVEVTAEELDEADQVMRERIYFDEDLGFDYRVQVVAGPGPDWDPPLRR